MRKTLKFVGKRIAARIVRTSSRPARALSLTRFPHARPSPTPLATHPGSLAPRVYRLVTTEDGLGTLYLLSRQSDEGVRTPRDGICTPLPDACFVSHFGSMVGRLRKAAQGAVL
jgi:hypothetical protein